MKSLVKRNLKIFFRDKMAVFYSLLASFIMIGLYFLFLGDNLSNSLPGGVDGKSLMDNWLIAGLLATTSVTTTLGVFGIRIMDNVRKISKDFYAAPVKRSHLAVGYIGSAFLVGLLMSVLTLIVAEIFIYLRGGIILQKEELAKILAIILLADFSNSAMMFFITSLFSTYTAYSSAGSIIGTLIGFVTGIYLPIGSLPDWVQWVVKVFPTSHAASLMRQVMMNRGFGQVYPKASAGDLLPLKEQLGLQYVFGNHVLSNGGSILILIGTGICFYLLGVLRLSKKNK